MRLRHIEVFHAVMVGGSLSAAARLLNMTQPAVSQTMNSLELQLGFALFQRVKGRLAPTPEAHALHAEVEKLNSQLDAVKLMAVNLRQDGPARLRILAAPALAMEVVPDALAAFMADSPNARMTVKTGYSGDILAALLLRDADIGLVYRCAPQALIRQETVGRGMLVCVAPADRYAGRDHVTLADLRDSAVFVPERRHPMGRRLAQLCADQVLDADNHVEIEQFHVALKLATAGLGVALVDSLTALGADLRRVRILALRPEVGFEVCVAYPEFDAHPHLSHRFARCVREVVAGRQARMAPG